MGSATQRLFSAQMPVMEPVMMPLDVLGNQVFSSAPIFSSAPTEKQRPADSPVELQDPPFRVTVFDNSSNTYEEVVAILQLATGCSADEAYIETWEIDHFGQCVVHRANQGECADVAKIIGKIGIRVEVECDLG